MKRPRHIEGLWVLVRTKDGAEVEGMMPNDLLAATKDIVTVMIRQQHASYPWKSTRFARADLVSIEVLGINGGEQRTGVA